MKTNLLSLDSKTPSQLVVALTIFITAIFAFVNVANFPFALYGDAFCFLPQAVNFAQGEGLRNAYIFKYLPDGDFVWHGFLYQLVLGGLFNADTYTKVSFAIAALNSLNVVLLGLALSRVTRPWALMPRALFLLACLLVQIGFLQGLLGRPESLTSLLISAGVLTWTFKPKTWVYVLMGCLVGLLAVTSPVPAVWASGCLALGLFVRISHPRGFFAASLAIAAGALIAIVASFSFYPYSVGQWLWGLDQHAQKVIKEGDDAFSLASLLRQFVISTGRLFMGPLFAGSVMAAAFLMCKSCRESRWRGTLATIMLVVVSLAILRFSIGGFFYYVTCLFPIGALTLGNFLAGQNKRLLFPLTAFLYVSLSVSACDPLLLRVGRMLGYEGLPFQEARRFLAEDLQSKPGEISLSMDLSVLSDSTDRLQVFWPPHPLPKVDTRWLVVQQHCFFYDDPPVVEGYRLAKDRFGPKSRLPGRLWQWFSPNGFGYAIYERIE